MINLQGKIKKRIIAIAIFVLLKILLFLILLKVPANSIFNTALAMLSKNSSISTCSDISPSGNSLSNEYVCSHYFSLLADEMDCSETPFRTGEYPSFTPGSPAMLKRNFVSSGIYLPLEMETAEGTAIIYTIVAYWLTPEGEVKEDLIALGVALPDGRERFFLEDPTLRDLQAARASMKLGVVFTATLTGFVSQHGVDWAGCPNSDFANKYGVQACLVGAALTERNPPDVSSGFTGSFLFGWQLARTGEMIAFPICQYIEE